MTHKQQPPASETLHEHVLATAVRRSLIPAVVAPGLVWTWADLGIRLKDAAESLARAGLDGGQRLVIVSENSPSTVALMLAAQSLRAWPAVVNAGLPRLEVLKLIDRADPRLVVFATHNSKAVQRHARELGAAAFAVRGLGPLALIGRSPQIEATAAAELPGDEVASMIFTSGTTGMPKAVMISHRGMINHGSVCGAARQTKPEDTVEVVAPLSHVMGHTGVLTALIYGATMRIRPRLAASELLHAISHGEVTQASMVPMAWVRLLEQIDKERLDLSGHKLRTLVSGGAPLAPDLKARIEQAFGRPVQNAYGMTEVAPLARTGVGHPLQPWSVGRPEGNVEIRIVDDREGPVEGGQIGEIQARGPSVMKGYFDDPEATEAVMRAGGWYATGDLGRWLPDGDLAVVGRRKEMIIRSGFNVYPSEVEAVLDAHPSVLHCAVVGETLPSADELVVAYVQARASVSGGEQLRNELTEHLREHLAPYKCPSIIEFVATMPMGSTGKIIKRELSRRDSAGNSH